MTLWLKSIAASGLMAVIPAAAMAADSFEAGISAAGRADYPDALRLFGEAATQGDAKSQFALAEMYRQGQGVRADDQTALIWYRKAAAQDNPGAEFSLGLFYQLGQGVPRNDRTAASWYARAATQGYASAEVRLGVFYAKGLGVPRSAASAALWLRRAVDQGDPDARVQLTKLGIEDQIAPKARFRAIMDRVFGPGRWRETSGYRSLAKENELRREGAGTVRLGERSRHSVGSPDAPGAYDVVVVGMSPERAAAKLRNAREQLARVVAEVAHGNQGPHLHVEPGVTLVSDRAPAAVDGQPVYLRIANRAPNPTLGSGSSPTPPANQAATP